MKHSTPENVKLSVIDLFHTRVDKNSFPSFRSSRSRLVGEVFPERDFDFPDLAASLDLSVSISSFRA